MSAKDVAFAREREKFQQKINQINVSVVKRDIEIRDLNKKIVEKDKKIEELERQNEELLSLCKMSPEEIRQYIEDKRKVASAAKSLSGMMDVIGGIGF
jgi:predicted RNase H-like nuclease (RuvC/YqgF family)